MANGEWRIVMELTDQARQRFLIESINLPSHEGHPPRAAVGLVG